MVEVLSLSDVADKRDRKQADHSITLRGTELISESDPRVMSSAFVTRQIVSVKFLCADC